MFHLPESSEIEKQKWLNSPKARVLDLIKGGIDLPGHIGAGVFNFVFQTDVTSAPLEFRGWDRGIGIGEERSTGERGLGLALMVIPEAKFAGASLVRSAEREVAIAARGIGSNERNEPTRQPIAMDVPTYLKNEVAKSSRLRTPGFCSSLRDEFRQRSYFPISLLVAAI